MSNLSDIHKHWDNNTLNYDLKKFNWPEWALSVIQEVAPSVKELETLHEVLTPSEIVKVSKHVFSNEFSAINRVRQSRPSGNNYNAPGASR